MDRKGKKRKEREKMLKERKRKREENVLKLGRENKRFVNLVQKDVDAQKDLECEVLLATLGVEIDNHTLSEARRYIECLGFLGDGFNSLGNILDDLFLFAHGKTSHAHPRGISDFSAHQAISQMHSILKRFDKRAQSLAETRLGSLVCDMEELEKKLRAACQSMKDRILSWVRQRKLLDESLDIKEAIDSVFKGKGIEPPLLEIGKDSFPYDEEIDYDFAVNSLIESVDRPISMIGKWKLGVPTDFYRDVAEVLTQISISSKSFFLKLLYQEMTRRIVESLPDNPLAKPHTDGMIYFRNVLNAFPEKVLLDPVFFNGLKMSVRRLDQLDGGDGVIAAFLCLTGCGESHTSALAKLERLGRGQHIYSVVSEMLSSSGTWKDFLLQLFCEYPSFVPAYEILRALRFSSEDAAKFLCDYGDYSLGDSNLAQIICSLERKPEAIRLVVENALYVSCGEGAHEILALIEDMKRGTRALRYYVDFARALEPFKQLALLRYVKHRGIDGLDDFVENIRKQSELCVGDILRESDIEIFISRMATFEQDIVEHPVHRLKKLLSFDLISRYGLAPEIADIDDEALRLIDSILVRVRDSRYESILLGQKHLRQIFIERVRTTPLSTSDFLSHLPEEGNPYLILRNFFIPQEDTSSEGAGLSEEENRAIVEFKRVILISGGIDADVLLSLESDLGVPIHCISTDASANRLSGIAVGDIVIYDTSRTSHSTYYRAKHLAIRRGAIFRHTQRIHKEALLEVLRS